MRTKHVLAFSLEIKHLNYVTKFLLIVRHFQLNYDSTCLHSGNAVVVPGDDTDDTTVVAAFAAVVVADSCYCDGCDGYGPDGQRQRDD